MANLRTGTKQTAETKAKRSQSLRRTRADPERNASWIAAANAGIAKWHADPANALAHATRASDRMRKRHADPEWQKVRDERSSRTMKATWEKHRARFIAMSAERYVRQLETGTGINSPEAIGRKNAAAKWIMKKAQEAMHAETDYDATYAEVQARLRREMPYDGPQDGSEYMDYLQKLGRAVVSSAECREISDTFMSKAIPHFAKQYRERKAAPEPA